MAQNTNNQELRQQALRALAEGRAEISAEVHRVRQQLNPARVLRRVYDHYPGLIVSLAVAVGLVPALLIFREKRPNQTVTISAAPTPAKPVLGALLTGALALLAKTITPAVIKSTIIPQVIDFISKKQSRDRNWQESNVTRYP